MGFPETGGFGEVGVARGEVGVLLQFGTETVFLGGATDASGQFVLDVREGLGWGDGFTGGGRELLIGELEEGVYCPLPPARETGIVH